MRKTYKINKDFQQLELKLPVNNPGCINKNLSKKSAKSKVKKACGSKKLSGLFFDNLISVEELAVIFGLAPQTIRNWVAQGKLPYVKLGKRNLFLRRSLQEWLNQKEKPQWQ